MIQFKRGTTASWKKLKTPLAAGQPGYDKDKHKIKVGDGESAWADLPDSSGLRMEEILLSEEDAKKRANGFLNPLDLLRKMLKLADRPIITYGEEAPDKNTLGQVYLQHYDTEPEADYIIAFYKFNGWICKKWKSGFASCVISFDFDTSVQTAIDDTCIYYNTTAMRPIDYPFTFKDIPSEIASVKSSGGLVWLGASKMLNTETATAVYNILSADKLVNSAKYRISIKVEGFLKDS